MPETKKNRILILIVHVVAIGFLYSLVVLQAEQAAGSTNKLDPGVDSTAVVFLPVISKLGSQSIPADIPLSPETYESEQNTPPQLSDSRPSIQCQSFIRFSNYTNSTIYIYWIQPDGTDLFYKLLTSGRQYWQHTYLSNQWHVRDDEGRLIQMITATRCDNTFIDIYIGDLPACGRITNVALWDLTTDRAMPGYTSLTDGAVIEVERAANVNLRVTTLPVIESIKFTVNGVVFINNLIPYGFPDNQQPWQPEPGTYTVVIEAYRQNDAKSALCDQRRMTLQVGVATTPAPTLPFTLTPTVTPTLTPIPTQTTLTPTPSTTATASATVIPTASPTVTPPLCPGKITDLHLFDLTNGQPVAAHNPLLDGAVIDLATLPRHFNLEAGVSGPLESVSFEVNRHVIIENFTPYRYPGGDLTAWQPAAGFYTVRAVAYSQDGAAGAVCDIKLLTLTVINSVPTATPTLTPTPTATNTPTPPLVANCIGDWVWQDADADGIQDDGERGLAGAPVYLGPDADGNGRLDRILASTTTDSAGRYHFCTLAPATYLVEFSAPAGCINTGENQGSDDAVDSDASMGYGISPPIPLSAGNADSTIDAGFICY